MNARTRRLVLRSAYSLVQRQPHNGLRLRHHRLGFHFDQLVLRVSVAALALAEETIGRLASVVLAEVSAEREANEAAAKALAEETAEREAEEAARAEAERQQLEAMRNA